MDYWLLAGIAGFLSVVGFAYALIRTARRHHAPPTVPPCFLSDPGPQEQAENCCHDCKLEPLCVRDAEDHDEPS